MMMFKQHLVRATFAALAVGLFSQEAAASSFDRGDRQERRIHRGVANGELTHREARFLIRQQHAISHAENRAMADGHVSWHEQRRLDHLRDRASRDIATLTHDHDRGRDRDQDQYRHRDHRAQWR